MISSRFCHLLSWMFVSMVGCAPVQTMPIPAAVPEPVTVKPIDDGHSVKKTVSELPEAAARFAQAGAPSMGLLILAPNEQPYQSWQVSILSRNAEDGSLQTETSTIQSGLPGVPAIGWKAEAATLQQTLLQAGLNLIDLPLGSQNADEEPPAALLVELQLVVGAQRPQAQARILDARSGAIVAIERAGMVGRDAAAFRRAASTALAVALDTATQARSADR